MTIKNLTPKNAARCIALVGFLFANTAMAIPAAMTSVELDQNATVAAHTPLGGAVVNSHNGQTGASAQISAGGGIDRNAAITAGAVSHTPLSGTVAGRGATAAPTGSMGSSVLDRMESGTIQIGRGQDDGVCLMEAVAHAQDSNELFQVESRPVTIVKATKDNPRGEYVRVDGHERLKLTNEIEDCKKRKALERKCANVTGSCV